MLLGGVFVSITDGPKGVLGFVFVLPDRQLVAPPPPNGEHARRFDFLDERFRKRSLEDGNLKIQIEKLIHNCGELLKRL
jgi:hypothetical protein